MITGLRTISPAPGQLLGTALPAGPIGPRGPSPYDLAVANGFRGSVADWLASLVGGADGLLTLAAGLVESGNAVGDLLAGLLVKPSAADIRDGTATGRAVLTAADPSAARSALGAGLPSGLATLGVDGTVPAAQVPAAIRSTWRLGDLARIMPSARVLVGDGLADDTTALNSVLAYAAAAGIRVSGFGATFATTAPVLLPAGLDIEDLTVTRGGVVSGYSIIRANAADGLRARRLKIIVTGDGTGGVMSNSYGLWINGGANIDIQGVDCSGPGKISHIYLLGCRDSYFGDLHVHDGSYNDPSAIDDVIQGIWAWGTIRCLIDRPRVETLTGNGALRPGGAMGYPAGASANSTANLWTRGISCGASYKLTIRDPYVHHVDQAIDVSSSTESIDVLIMGGHLHDLESYGIKFANYNRNCKAVGSIVERAGRVAFVNSGPASAPSASPYSPTGFSRPSIGNQFLGCTAKDTGGKLDATGGQIRSYYASGTPPYAHGFSVEGGGQDASSPRGTLIQDCVAQDTQASPTMQTGFRNGVPYTRNSRQYNEAIGCRSVGHTVSATLQMHEPRCSLQGGTSGSTAVATGTVGGSPTGSVVIPFTVELYDPCDMHSTSSAPLYGSIFVDAGGRYEIDAGVFWPSNATGFRQLDIYVDGVRQALWSVKSAAQSESFTQRLVATLTIPEAATASVVDIRATSSATTTISLDNTLTYVNIRRVSI